MGVQFSKPDIPGEPCFRTHRTFSQYLFSLHLESPLSSTSKQREVTPDMTTKVLRKGARQGCLLVKSMRQRLCMPWQIPEWVQGNFCQPQIRKSQPHTSAVNHQHSPFPPSHSPSLPVVTKLGVVNRASLVPIPLPMLTLLGGCPLRCYETLFSSKQASWTSSPCQFTLLPSTRRGCV